jgi:hypothetical protein
MLTSLLEKPINIPVLYIIGIYCLYSSPTYIPGKEGGRRREKKKRGGERRRKEERKEKEKKSSSHTSVNFNLQQKKAESIETVRRC